MLVPISEIRTLVSQIVITEGRIDNVKKRYPGRESEISWIAENDPSGNQKYLAWASKQCFENDYEVRRVVSVINRFHKVNQRLERKDINSYQNVEDVEQAIEDVGDSKSKIKKEIATGSEVVWSDDRFVLVHPKTQEASCKYGKETKWCIAAKNDNRFNDYDRAGSMFYFLIDRDKKLPSKFQKIAFEIDRDTKEVRFMYDSEDDNFSPENVDQSQFEKEDFVEEINHAKRLSLDHYERSPQGELDRKLESCSDGKTFLWLAQHGDEFTIKSLLETIVGKIKFRNKRHRFDIDLWKQDDIEMIRQGLDWIERSDIWSDMIRSEDGADFENLLSVSRTSLDVKNVKNFLKEKGQSGWESISDSLSTGAGRYVQMEILSDPDNVQVIAPYISRSLIKGIDDKSSSSVDASFSWMQYLDEDEIEDIVANSDVRRPGIIFPILQKASQRNLEYIFRSMWKLVSTKEKIEMIHKREDLVGSLFEKHLMVDMEEMIDECVSVDELISLKKFFTQNFRPTSVGRDPRITMFDRKHKELQRSP